MRFRIHFKDYKTKSEKNINLELLEIFLNEYTIDTYCGETFNGIHINFLNHAPMKRVEKECKYYSIFAKVEIKSSFLSHDELNLDEFNDAFNKIFHEVRRVNKINIENMQFDLTTLMGCLVSAKDNIPKTLNDLENYLGKSKVLERNNFIRLIDHIIKRDKENPRELNKHFVGIRAYSNLKYENIDYLQPYLFIYETIFTNLLRVYGLMLPGYSEIYLYIHKTLDEAKLSSSSADWSKRTFAKIDVEKFLLSGEDEKSKMVFNSVCSALRLIADYDHLDKDLIERAISTVDEKGIDFPLIYAVKENKNYMVLITHNVPKTFRGDALFKLAIKDKNTGKESEVELDYINLWYAPYSIGKIKINKKEVIVEGRKSNRAEVSRRVDKLPEKYVFSISDLLK